MLGRFFGRCSSNCSNYRETIRPAVVEALEDRRHLSAATVWASLRPLTSRGHPHAVHAKLHDVHAKPKVGTAPKVVNTSLPVNLVGEWTGTYTSNSTQKSVDGGITFTSRRKDTFVGIFDTNAIGGGSTVSSVTVTKNRVFMVMVKFAPGEQVSMTGTVTSDFKVIMGRYSIQTLKKWATGIFRFTRPT